MTPLYLYTDSLTGDPSGKPQQYSFSNQVMTLREVKEAIDLGAIVVVYWPWILTSSKCFFGQK